jgi:hypothetical protein
MGLLGRDALFATRQAESVQHEENARAALEAARKKEAP